MSELAKEARAKSREKAKRLTGGDPHQKVDASSWSPPEPLEANVQTGERPVSRQFKSGGHVDGEHARHHAGRKARKAGGRLVNDFVNRDVKAANEERSGPKHDGGMKKGGRAHKDNGGPLAGALSQGVQTSDAVAPAARFAFNYKAKGGKVHEDAAEDKKLVKSMVKPVALKGGKEIHDASCACHKCSGGMARARGGSTETNVERHHHTCECHKCRGGSVSDGELEGARPTGGRLARASGGKAKGKTDINIIINPEKGGGMPMGAGPPPMLPKPPPNLPPGIQAGAPGGGPPPQLPPGAGMAALGGPGTQPPPMPRKRGGRTHQPAGAGSGLGRLEKIEEYGDRA